jgi:O-antigen chain-terminating methyltransferase
VTEVYQPELRAEELTARARAAWEERTLSAPSEAVASRLSLPDISLQPPFTPRSRRAGYDAGELLQFHDEAFVRHAYLALLGREPEPEGAKGFLAALREGRVNRLDVLARLRFSAEGVARNVPLRGVRGPTVLRRAYRAPVFGPALRWLVSVARLPRLVRHVNQIEAHLTAQQEQLAAHANRLNHHYAALVEQHAARLDELTAQQRELERWHETATATYAEMAQVSLTQLAGEFHAALAKVAAAQEESAALYRQLEAQQRHADEELARLAAQKDELDARLNAQQGEFTAQLAGQQSAFTQTMKAQDESFARRLAAQQDEAARGFARVSDELATARAASATQAAQTARDFAAGMERLAREAAAQRERFAAQLAARAAQARAQHNVLLANYENLAAQLADAETRRAEAQTHFVGELRAAAAHGGAQTQALRAELVLQGGRVERLLALAQERLPAAPLTDAEAAQLSAERQHALDAFYVALEDRLRGSRETILARLRVYLPWLRENGLGGAARPVLDVGCGRGEWLELLRDEGFTAAGVDANRVVIEQCRALGLSVTEGDLMAYLHGLPDASQGVVTCFHVVEHLPLETVLQMLGEALRVLQPGGLAIFETPNPRNVLVGSCNFYYDPTHRNPLPGPVLQFMLEARGFARVEVLDLNPSDAQPVAGDDDLVRRFNEYFYGPMDYAALGWKPATGVAG